MPGLALGERFPNLIKNAGKTLEVRRHRRHRRRRRTGSGRWYQCAVGAAWPAQARTRSARGKPKRSRVAVTAIDALGGSIGRTPGGFSKLASSFGSFIVFAGRSIGLLSVSVGKAVVTTIASAMAKVGATGGLSAFGSKLGAATVGLGALALVAAAVNLALTSEPAKDKDTRISAERKAMEERLGRPVSDVGFALRGMPEEMLRGMGLGFIADAIGMKDHTKAREIVAADAAAAGPPLITAAAVRPRCRPAAGAAYHRGGRSWSARSQRRLSLRASSSRCRRR